MYFPAIHGKCVTKDSRLNMINRSTSVKIHTHQIRRQLAQSEVRYI